MKTSTWSNAFACPIPFAESTKPSAVKLSGRSAYSYFLTRNVFAYLIGACSIALQIYFYVSLGIFKDAYDYYTDEPEEPLVLRSFNGGPVIFNRTSYQPQCMSNQVVVCADKEEAVFLEAIIVGTLLLIITVAPEICNGIRLVLLGRIEPVIVGIIQSVMGLVAIVFGFAWSSREATDGFSFILHMFVLLFIDYADEKLYSYFACFFPAWHESIFSNIAGEDGAGRGGDSITEERKDDEIALDPDLFGAD